MNRLLRKNRLPHVAVFVDRSGMAAENLGQLCHGLLLALLHNSHADRSTDRRMHSGEPSRWRSQED